MRKSLWVLLATLMLLLAAAPGLAFAAGQGQAVVPGQTPTPNQINEVARELWCPLCNGVRLDNCDLQACIQMKEVINEKLTAGESAADIRAYFVQQYGDVVLGQPPREGFNLIAWIFPILAAVVGIGWVTYLVLAWRKRQPSPVPAAASTIDPKRPRKPGEEADDYMQRVEKELRKTND
jgi:cytochrome c-type biogenesis protein CcmH